MANQSGKGKKRQSDKKKLKRAQCRENAKRAAQARREAQDERAAVNRALRAAGKKTRWELAALRRRFNAGQFDLIGWTKQGGFDEAAYYDLRQQHSYV